MLVEHFPDIPGIDSYMAFPTGWPICWPPGFDLLVALPCLLTGDIDLLTPWGAVLAPLLGGLAVYLTYRLGQRMFDRPTGLVAAIFMALMTGAINYTSLGRVDHHSLVAPVTLGMFLCFLASIQAKSRSRALVWGGLCGLLVAYSVAAWIITPPLYFLPIPIVLVWLCLRGKSRTLRTTAYSVMASQSLLVFVVVVSIADLQARPFALFTPSWLFVILFACAALWVIVAIYRPLLSLVLPLIAFLGLLFLILFAPDVLAPFFKILGVIAGEDFSFGGIEESYPLFIVGGVFTFNRAIDFYSNLILVWPFIWGIYLKTEVFGSHRDNPPKVLFAVYSLLALAFLMVQQRFGEYAAPAVSLLFAWALTAGGKKLLHYFYQTAFRKRMIVFSCLQVTLLFIALFPIFKGLTFHASTDRLAYPRVMLEFGKYLGQTTPDPKDPQGNPTYGILSSEQDANLILESAKRPVLAGPFGTPEVVEARKVSFRLLLASDEENTFKLLQKLKIRYVVTSPIVQYVQDMANLAGIPYRFKEESKEMIGENMEVSVRLLQPFFESIHTRLFLADGSLRRDQEVVYKSLKHFRLHLETKAIAHNFNNVPLIKAFEIVPGAHLVGNAKPKEPVQLRLAVKTNTGRRFTYQQLTTANQDGEFEFVVPYSTEKNPAPCHPTSPYRIKTGDKVHHVSVAESAVQQGKTVQLLP
jgi:dolichyl-diphosphooligosaccharide--protein glycosyltransferase